MFRTQILERLSSLFLPYPYPTNPGLTFLRNVGIQPFQLLKYGNTSLSRCCWYQAFPFQGALAPLCNNPDSSQKTTEGVMPDTVWLIQDPADWLVSQCLYFTNYKHLPDSTHRSFPLQLPSLSKPPPSLTRITEIVSKLVFLFLFFFSPYHIQLHNTTRMIKNINLLINSLKTFQ